MSFLYFEPATIRCRALLYCPPNFAGYRSPCSEFPVLSLPGPEKRMSWKQVSNTGLFLFSVWIFTGCGGSASLSKNFPDLVIITTELPRGTAELPYALSLRAQGGVAPYWWKLASGALPSGLALDSSSGAITGTPLSAAESVVDIQVRERRVFYRQWIRTHLLWKHLLAQLHGHRSLYL